MKQSHEYVIRLDHLNSKDVPRVGGKNASLGEMIQKLKKQKIRVPEGFATTSQAFEEFIHYNDLEEKIFHRIDQFRKKKLSLEKTGSQIRQLFTKAQFPPEICESIEKAYEELSKMSKTRQLAVAVRSSATAEDLPEASFAGQQETFLNVQGKEHVVRACIRCYASLFTDRAIIYREEKGFDHRQVAISVGVQKMVRADQGGAGVMFSLDTDTGFPGVVLINAGWGLGENVVQGSINPDEYLIFKPFLDQKNTYPILDKILGEKEKKLVYAKSKDKPTKNISTSKKERTTFVLSDREILQLAKWAVAIETHYKAPMDIEWAKDGKNGDLFIVQARPETIQSQIKISELKTFKLQEKGEKLVEGLSIGQAIASGKVQVIKDVKEIGRFREGCILVTEMTDPDWVPIMKKASGIITDHGGRTSHAAIVSRELGLPAVIGSANATSILKDGMEITLSCAEGEKGYIYKGLLKFDEKSVDLSKLPKIRTQIMLNIATPEGAFQWWKLPCKGIGLARMEFIINNIIKIHPMALVDFKKVKDQKARSEIEKLTKGYPKKTEYFIELLSKGIAKIAASQYPNPVIVRMSDFKTNEYANLIGGKAFEPVEENPMIGFRGASRYYSDLYRQGFELECKAIRRAREKIGLTNILVMIPFCRTLEEADKVLHIMSDYGLKRGKNGLEIYVMCEVPSNVILADGFSDRFDGFSIGSNDLTQLTLGIDRDSQQLASLFDEENEAVKQMIREVIAKAHQKKRKVGFCGQAPSDRPAFAEFLVRSGIDSISLNPDSVVGVISKIAKFESKK